MIEKHHTSLVFLLGISLLSGAGGARLEECDWTKTAMPVLLKLASSYLQALRTSESTRCSEAAIVQQPFQLEGWHMLAKALYSAGKIEQAARVLVQAGRIHNASGVTFRSIGQLQSELGQMRKAVESLRRAVRLEPHQAAFHFSLGSVLQEAGAVEEAERELRQAVRLDATHPGALNNLANLLRTMGQVEESIEVLRAAVGIEPTAHELYLNLGSALYSTGQAKEAAEHFLAATRLQPDMAQAYSALGWAWDAVGEEDKAVQALLHAARRGALSLDAAVHLAHRLAQRASYEEAMQLLDNRESVAVAAVAAAGVGTRRSDRVGHGRQAEFVLLWRARVDVLLAQGSLVEAERALARCKQEAQGGSTELQDQCDQPPPAGPAAPLPPPPPPGKRGARAASAQAEPAQASGPEEGDPESLNQAALTQYRAGDLERAVRSSRAALALRLRAPCLITLGAALYEQRDFQASVGAFEDALRIEPHNTIARFNLANVLTEVHMYGASIREFRRVLQIQPSMVEAQVNMLRNQEVICDWDGRHERMAQIERIIRLRLAPAASGSGRSAKDTLREHRHQIGVAGKGGGDAGEEAQSHSRAAGNQEEQASPVMVRPWQALACPLDRGAPHPPV